MAAHSPPVPGRRFMVFVPEAVPHFVLVCFENAGWLVRDYSSGNVRLLPTIALRRPIEHIVSGGRAAGCFAFNAPRVAVSNHSFWKRLTDELGQRFLGKTASLADLPGHSYPVVAEPEFKKATGHLSSVERERLLRSPRSPGWTTWNAMQLLIAGQRDQWWSQIALEAARENPANQFLSESLPGVGFWKRVAPSEAYDKWWKIHTLNAPKSGRGHVRALESRPVEEPTRVDLSFETESFIVFAESGMRLKMSDGTQLDPRRNRIIQLVDCLLTAAKERPCALWIFARDRSPDREYVQAVEQYRASPEMFSAELPYHSAEALYGLAQRLTIVRWADIVGSLVARCVTDDAVTTRVRKELRRRIQPGEAMKTAAVTA